MGNLVNSPYFRHQSCEQEEGGNLVQYVNSVNCFEAEGVLLESTIPVHRVLVPGVFGRYGEKRLSDDQLTPTFPSFGTHDPIIRLKTVWIHVPRTGDQGSRKDNINPEHIVKFLKNFTIPCANTTI